MGVHKLSVVEDGRMIEKQTIKTVPQFNQQLWKMIRKENKTLGRPALFPGDATLDGYFSYPNTWFWTGDKARGYVVHGVRPVDVNNQEEWKRVQTYFLEYPLMRSCLKQS